MSIKLEISSKIPPLWKTFRSKPVAVQAIQFAPNCVGHFVSLFSKGVVIRGIENDEGEVQYCIETLEGFMNVNPGDWIIKGVAGEYYPCKDEIFKQTYEEVKE